jgi:hypothetical protein
MRFEDWILTRSPEEQAAGKLIIDHANIHLKNGHNGKIETSLKYVINAKISDGHYILTEADHYHHTVTEFQEAIIPGDTVRDYPARVYSRWRDRSKDHRW